MHAKETGRVFFAFGMFVLAVFVGLVALMWFIGVVF